MSNKVNEIIQTTKLIKEITASLREQQTSTEQINVSVLELNSPTQQTATLSEQIASNARKLCANTLNPTKLMSYFKTAK